MMVKAHIKSARVMPAIRKDVNLGPMNTLGVETRAGQFVEIRNSEQLRLLFEDGFFRRQSPVVLGEGSNILFISEPDRPVVKLSVKGREIKSEDDGTVLLKAGAGENWHQLVKHSVEKGLGGIENLALIPGTVGAAPIQNIGAYGIEMKDVFHSLTAFDIKTGKFQTFSAADCGFGYRDSVFKNELKGRVIVCDVTLRLTKDSHNLNLSYSGLNDYLESKKIVSPTINDVFKAVVNIRRSKLPDPSDIGNAGSFFKNPVVSQNVFEQLQSRFSDLVAYPLQHGQSVKLAAGWLIEQCGWKGYRNQWVGVHNVQALVLINHGGGSGTQLLALAQEIRESVEARFGVELEQEPLTQPAVH